MQAIILAGGLGTRLRPLTDNMPKPLLPVAGKPIMQHAIENLKDNGIKDIILGISYYADRIKEYFGTGSMLGVNITYSIEAEPLGTGGAVKQAAEGIKEPFVLLWGDVIMNRDLKKMIMVHKQNDALLTMALTIREDLENWGVAKLAGDKIVAFVEKPPRAEAPSNLINAGTFIVNPEILAVLPAGRSNIERECFEKICGQDGRAFAFQHQGYWFPTDTLEKYNQANTELEQFQS